MDFVVEAGEDVSVLVFDGRSAQEGSWAGFLGACVVPAALLIDSHAAKGGAVPVTFRLKKRVQEDRVTGTVALRARVLGELVRAPVSPDHGASSPVAIPRGPLASPTTPRVGGGEEQAASPLLATSPGVGWQTLREGEAAGADTQSLLPPCPGTVLCHAIAGDPLAIQVSWDGGGVRQRLRMRPLGSARAYLRCR